MTQPATALLIDDEPIITGPITDAFTDNGLGLDVAASWSEGMGLFELVGHELVIADYDLNEAKTGLRLLAEIKRLAPSTRLVLISGRLTDEAHELVEGSKAVDVYLMKTDPAFRSVLLEEGRQAQLRSTRSDWSALGDVYPHTADVDLQKIRQLEEELRLHLRSDS